MNRINRATRLKPSDKMSVCVVCGNENTGKKMIREGVGVLFLWALWLTIMILSAMNDHHREDESRIEQKNLTASIKFAEDLSDFQREQSRRKTVFEYGGLVTVWDRELFKRDDIPDTEEYKEIHIKKKMYDEYLKILGGQEIRPEFMTPPEKPKDMVIESKPEMPTWLILLFWAMPIIGIAIMGVRSKCPSCGNRANTEIQNRSENVRDIEAKLRVVAESKAAFAALNRRQIKPSPERKIE